MSEGWSPLDVCYYLTTTVTTVGFGDFAPASETGRWLTSIYAPFGTVTVMSALLPPVEFTLLQVDMLTAWPIAAASERLTEVLGYLSASKWKSMRRHLSKGNLLVIGNPVKNQSIVFPEITPTAFHHTVHRTIG